MTTPGIRFHVADNGEAGVSAPDADWLRQELGHAGTFGSPSHTVTVMLDEMLQKLQIGAELPPVVLSQPEQEAVVRALATLRIRDDERFHNCSLARLFELYM